MFQDQKGTTKKLENGPSLRRIAKLFVFFFISFINKLPALAAGNDIVANVPTQTSCSPQTDSESQRLGVPKICINDQISVLSSRPIKELSAYPNMPGIVTKIDGLPGSETFYIRVLDPYPQVKTIPVKRQYICPTGHLCSGDIVLVDKMNPETKTLNIYKSVVLYTTVTGNVSVQRLYNRRDPTEKIPTDDNVSLTANEVKSNLHRSVPCFMLRFCIGKLVNENRFLSVMDNQQKEISILEVFSNGDVTIAPYVGGKIMFTQVTNIEILSESWSGNPKNEMKQSMSALVKQNRYAQLSPQFYVSKCKSHVTDLQQNENYQTFLFKYAFIEKIKNSCTAITNSFAFECFKDELKQLNDVPREETEFHLKSCGKFNNSFALQAFKIAVEPWIENGKYQRYTTSEGLEILSKFKSLEQVKCMNLIRDWHVRNNKKPNLLDAYNDCLTKSDKGTAVVPESQED
ncbi:MAG: hypothetical protein J0M15_04700 [Deltaproteobacteria bacterium]|jgi:hypothetical protein|nr:hypothetical protein [Deltaproteobacteria bacterium]